MPFALDYAAKLATRSPLSHRFAKEVVQRSIEQHMDEALRLESRSFHDFGLTEDMSEGSTAFKEKRGRFSRGVDGAYAAEGQD